MRVGHKFLLLQPALVLGLCHVSHSAQFDFNYAFPVTGVPGGVIASGTLTTTAFDPVAMDYTIIGVTGSRTVGGVTDVIASLLPPASFGGNDNLLLPASPYLTANGYSFTLATGGGDDGSGDVNVFFSPGVGAYSEDSSMVGFGSFTVTPVSSVPEPMPPTAAVLAIAAFVGATRSRFHRST